MQCNVARLKSICWSSHLSTHPCGNSLLIKISKKHFQLTDSCRTCRIWSLPPQEAIFYLCSINVACMFPVCHHFLFTYFFTLFYSPTTSSFVASLSSVLPHTLSSTPIYFSLLFIPLSSSAFSVWRSSSAGWALTIKSQGSSFTTKWPRWAVVSVWATAWSRRSWLLRTDTSSASPPWTWKWTASHKMSVRVQKAPDVNLHLGC